MNLSGWEKSGNRISENAVFISALLALTLLFAGSSDAQMSETALRLIGTIVSGNSGGAVLQDNAGKQFFYKLYDKLPNGSKIIELRDDSIALKGYDGTVYEMYVSHDMRTAGTTAPANSFSAPAANAPAAGAGVFPSTPASSHRRPNFRRQRRYSSSGPDEE